MRETPVRVLLVDRGEDLRWIQEVMAEIEESRFGRNWTHHIELVHVEWLHEAARAVREERFDVALLNPALPDSQGVHALLRLRSEAPDLPTVILAEGDDEDLATSLVSAGAQDYLIKAEVDCLPLARALRLAIERNRTGLALRSRAFFDDLTGAYNRTGFLAFGQHDWKVAARLGRPMVLLLAQLEGLDEIARSYGKSESELAVIETHDLLRDALRDGDVLARVRPDQFGALLIDGWVSSPLAVSEPLLRRFQSFHHKRPNRQCLRLRLEVALRTPRARGETFLEALTAAENGLYNDGVSEPKGRDLRFSVKDNSA